MSTAADLSPRAWVLLPLEAKSRGFRNALAFRRWCRSHAVEIRKDGRKEWVSPASVDSAVAPPPPAAPPPAANDNVKQAVARLMAGT